MFNLNPEVTQEGYLAAEPDVRFNGQTGEPIVTIRVLTNRRWTDKETGETQERVIGLHWTAFGKNAENMRTLLKKGSHVAIRGEIKNHSWDDETTGETRYRDEYQVRYWKLLDRKDGGGENATDAED